MEFKEQCEKRLGSCGRGEAQPTTGTSARCRREWGLLQLLIGVSYGPQVDLSELHFSCSFQGYPTWSCSAHLAKYPNSQISDIWPYLAIWIFGKVQSLRELNLSHQPLLKNNNKTKFLHDIMLHGPFSSILYTSCIINLNLCEFCIHPTH